jgi:alkylhydroperoxidase family enzyme
LLKRWLVFASHVMSKSSISARDRELAILRVGVRCQAPYEFGQHHMIAQRSDISLAEIEQVKDGPSHPEWSAFDAALLRAVDELHDDSMISDATWGVLAERYSVEQLLDLMFAIGNYHLVSFVLNSCGVVLDDGVPDTL